MRQYFEEYYKPTEADIDRAWREGIVVLDTNVLLHAYRYTPPARDRLFEVLEGLRDRLWIPHQVAYEFHKNRMRVKADQLRLYGDVRKEVIEKHLDAAVTYLSAEEAKGKYSTVDLPGLRKIVESARRRADKLLRQGEAVHPSLAGEDTVLDRLTALFESRVGPPYPADELKTRYQQAAERYRERIPPGYVDLQDKEKETDAEKYGDAILWFQLLDHAKTQGNPVVFVGDDLKEDWWVRHSRKSVGPRPELRREMRDRAGVFFLMYQPFRFMEKAEEFLALQSAPAVIDEVREVSRRYTVALSQDVRDALDALARQTSDRLEEMRRVADVFGEASWLAEERQRIARASEAFRVPAAQILAEREELVR